MLDVTEKNILILGGGKASAEKLRTLSQLELNVTVISPEFDAEFQDKPWLNLIKRKYQKGDLRNFDLVYSGVNHKPTEMEILSEANENKIPVNFVDNPGKSNFISASSLICDSFTIFISTYGRAPGGAKKIRETIESSIDLGALDAEVGEYIRLRDEKKNARSI